MTSPPLNGTERAIYGDISAAELLAALNSYAYSRLGSGVAEILFRAGRIDAVCGVRLDDGRDVVIKAHRAPVDLEARSAAVEAQHLLVAAGFPCPAPLSGPDLMKDLVLSAESLVPDGSPADAREPVIRQAIAIGLARHIDLLRVRPELGPAAGPGPAWCRYQDGPWPVPHDTIFDFCHTPPGYRWLDDFARQAAELVLQAGTHGETVVGHADWYGGNLQFEGGRIVASFDWELVSGSESVIAGFTAGAYTASSTSGGGMPGPGEVVAFLQDFEQARAHPFTGHEQRASAGAAAWVLAYNARCELSLLPPGSFSGPALDLAQHYGTEYLNLSW